MLNISFGEIFFILIGVLIFVRPEDLPAFMRKMGKLYRAFLSSMQKGKDLVDEIKNQIPEQNNKDEIK